MKNRIKGYITDVKKAFQMRRAERRMALFMKLVTQDEAWALYVKCVQNYINMCKTTKANTNYGTASAEVKKYLENMDIEVATLEWAIKIPQATIDKALVDHQKAAESDLRQEVQSEFEKQQSQEE